MLKLTSFCLPILFLVAIPHKLLLSQQKETNKTIQAGYRYLINHQKKDGSWKSEYYGNLKQGAATTALVLFAFSHADKSHVADKKGQLGQAFEFLKLGIKKHGYVANLSGPDYSNYATALTLLADRNFESRFQWSFLDQSERKKLVQFLIASQLDETHGLKPNADDYGGWDLSGWMQAPRSSPGTNISVSSFVLLALQDEKGGTVEACRAKARLWLKRVRNIDGGLHFHPKKNHAGNKAEWSDQKAMQPKSYGTPTIDGIRALRSLKAPQKEIQKCVQWLEKKRNSSKNLVPGFDEEGTENSWAKGLLYYYFMSLALERDCLTKELNERFEKQAIQYLSQHQKGNGSWENNAARMREDDPLIATSFAVIALSGWSKSESNEKRE